MEKLEIKQEIEVGICPYCNEEYEKKWYKSHKKCSECGMPFNLLEEKEKKEDEIGKYNRQIKKENNEQSENKNRYKKVIPRQEEVFVNNNKSSSPGTTFEPKSDEPESSEIVSDDKNERKSIFEDDDYEDVEIFEDYDSEFKEENNVVQLTENEVNIEKKELDRGHKFKNVILQQGKLLLKKDNRKEEREVSQSIFDSNKDGFYNDTEPVVEPQEDHIKKANILKMISIVLLLLLTTIFMIYYA